MKKIYLSAILLGMIGSVNAQERAQAISQMESLDNIQVEVIKPENNTLTSTRDVGAEIWADNFDDAANWTFDNTVNTGYTGTNYGWSIGTTVGSWWAPFSGGINSTSGGGFAELGNGDYFAATVDSTNGVTYTMTSIPLDIPNLPLNTTNTESVILSFEQSGALFNDGQTVQISVDGIIWEDIFTNNNRTVFVGNNNGALYDNPETNQISLTQFITGNASAVQIRFTWTSRFAGQNNLAAWTTFGWFIDDVKILSQPLNDVQVLSTYIVGATNGGIEYGRTPSDQLDTDWIIGANVLNFGSLDQPMTTLVADFTDFVANAVGLVESDSTRAVETTDQPALPIGIYTGDYTVSVAAELPTEPSFFDNTGSRTFEVTAGTYSMDGIGVYPSPLTASLGTNSFTDDNEDPVEDGMIVAVQYNIKTNAQVNSITALLANGTEEGGEIVAYLMDTTELLNDGTTPLYVSEFAVITAAHIAAGSITLSFPAPPTLTPGAYYAAVDLYSSAGLGTIRIVDDQTVGQPSTASMIYLPGFGLNTSYTNGTAFGVRMNIEVLGLEENALEGVSVYPNPSEGMVTISNDNNSSNDIVVYNMLGETIYTASSETKLSVDLSSVGAGVYLVKVSNESGSIVERVVIR